MSKCIVLIKNHDIEYNFHECDVIQYAIDTISKDSIEEVSKFIDTLDYDTIYVAGYSLCGLLALLVTINNHRVKGACVVSGSLWIEGVEDYLYEHPIQDKKLYFSIGKQEKKTRHPLMKNCIDICQRVSDFYKNSNIVLYELNNGNHFYEIPQRIEKSFWNILRM